MITMQTIAARLWRALTLPTVGLAGAGMHVCGDLVSVNASNAEVKWVFTAAGTRTDYPFNPTGNGPLTCRGNSG